MHPSLHPETINLPFLSKRIQIQSASGILILSSYYLSIEFQTLISEPEIVANTSE